MQTQNLNKLKLKDLKKKKKKKSSCFKFNQKINKPDKHKIVSEPSTVLKQQQSKFIPKLFVVVARTIIRFLPFHQMLH